jgi:starch synthase
MVYEGLKVPTGEKEGTRELICNVKSWEGGQREPMVYFLENMEYYEMRANVYGYTDDPIRFALLSRGVLEFLKASNWCPDVINCNDWHTGFLANYLRTVYKNEPKLKKIATIFSVHNLTHQGTFDHRFISELDVDDGRSPIASFFNERLSNQNFMKRGILFADIVNTVSENYAREIMTSEYGEGLDQLIKEVRTKVYGVLNGLDYDDFNPATDKIIKTNFSLKDLNKREKNKLDLEKEFGLPSSSTTPLLAIAGRLTEQKGLDLLIKVLPFLLAEYPIYFIAMGGGDNKYRGFFSDLEKQFPRQVGTHLLPNWILPRKIFAGSDLFLAPSKWEPGGITVIEAMRYGSIPVVRATGGLADTVVDYNPTTKKGTGFSFNNYNELSLFATIVRGLETYKDKSAWQGLIKQAMRQDFSWESSAQKYFDLYNRAMKFRIESLSTNPPRAFKMEEE